MEERKGCWLTGQLFSSLKNHWLAALMRLPQASRTYWGREDRQNYASWTKLILSWKELRFRFVLMNIPAESLHINLIHLDYLVPKRHDLSYALCFLQATLFLHLDGTGHTRKKKTNHKPKAKHWWKCRSLNICFPQHPKLYKICIKFYFQNHYKCSVCLAGGTLTWNDDSLHFSPYAAGYLTRIWNIWGKFICNDV